MSDVSSETGNKFPTTHPGVAWGPVAAVIVTVLALLGAQLLAGVILVSVYTGSDRSDWFTSTAGQFYFVLISDVLILSSVWGFLRLRRAKLRDLGFGRSPAWNDVGMALLGYVAYFAVFVVLSIVAGIVTPIDLEQRQELGFDNLFIYSDRLVALVSLVILPPIVEETVFRGFLFTGMRKKLKFLWAALITSAMFAALHLLGSSDGLLWIAALDTLVLSLVLCYLRERTGALWAPMMLHGAKNAIAFTILLASVTVL